MNAKIDAICQGLSDFAQSLTQEAARKTKEILLQEGNVAPLKNAERPMTYVSNPERPWMVAGGVALAAGIVGAVFSDDTSWPYILGAAGVASIVYGQSKKKTPEGPDTTATGHSAHGPKSYEIAEKVIEISKMVERKWRDEVENCKGMVQRTIEASPLSAEAKDSLLGETYTTERVSIDFGAIIARLNSQPATSFPLILSEFERIVTSSIDKAAAEQIAIYKKISQPL
ncbi:MAG: hypothetical protein HDS92_01100 [Bacteroidales bacterium]|nr:hypothetical protein [Bacteroidales bacterium]